MIGVHFRGNGKKSNLTGPYTCPKDGVRLSIPINEQILTITFSYEYVLTITENGK